MFRDTRTGALTTWLTSAATRWKGVPAGQSTLRTRIVGAGDFFGNGRVAYATYNRDNGDVSLLQMNASGEATSTFLWRTAEPRWQIIGAADFDGDGKSDLLLRHLPDRRLSIWLLNGTILRDTPLVSQLLPATGSQIWQVAATADFDGDLKADILLRNSSDGALRLWKMDAATVASTTTISDPKPLPWRLIDAADLDGDGKADLVLRHPGTGALEVWLMDGAIVRSRTAVAAIPEPHRRIVSLTDISGDGKADLVLQNMSSGVLDVWTMSGASVTATSVLGAIDRRWQVSSPIHYRHVHTHSDFNGDGNADLLLRHATTNQVATWELNGRERLRSDAFATVASSNWIFEQLGAFSGDSLSDVQLRNVNDRMVAFWEFNGQSVLNSDAVGTLLAGTWAGVAAGDLDGDGNSDLVFRNATNFELILWKMRGHAVIEAVSLGTLPSSSWIVAGAGDLNGDGRDDLVLRDNATNEVRLRLWEMKNGGSVVSDQSLGNVFESAWKIRGVADFTGDGIAELFLRHATSNQVAMWEIENGQVVPGSTAPFGAVVSSSWEHQSLADYDGDFHADILLRNTNAVAMWQMNGRTVLNSDGFATTSSASWRFHPGGTDGGAASMDLSAALRAAAAGPPLFVPVPPGLSTHRPSTPGPPTALPIGAGAPTWVPSFGPPTHIPPHAGPRTSTKEIPDRTPGDIASSSAQTHRRSYSLYTPSLNLVATTTATLTSTPAIAYEYIWFGGQPVAQWEATGTIHWYFNDHLGTPLLQADASANVVWRAEYDPYGRVFTFRTGATKHQPLRYPGQESNPGSELSYNVFRWYRDGWGRYTQADRYISVRAKEPNLYAYVGGNPISFTDPKGLYRIDSSCDCSAGLPNIPQNIARSCKYLKSPGCLDLARKYSLIPFYGNGRAMPLDQCLTKRCSADEVGRGPLIACSADTSQCGWTTPGGDIVLYRGNAACPRINEVNGPRGTGPFGPRDYSQTLFHETIHSCGWGPSHTQEFLELSKVCTGWE